MSPRRVAAVAHRIVSQFRHDHRSIALLIVAPLVVPICAKLAHKLSTKNLKTVIKILQVKRFFALKSYAQVQSPTSKSPLLRRKK